MPHCFASVTASKKLHDSKNEYVKDTHSAAETNTAKPKRDFHTKLGRFSTNMMVTAPIMDSGERNKRTSQRSSIDISILP